MKWIPRRPSDNVIRYHGDPPSGIESIVGFNTRHDPPPPEKVGMGLAEFVRRWTQIDPLWKRYHKKFEEVQKKNK
jgi:hypothetical protein